MSEKQKASALTEALFEEGPEGRTGSTLIPETTTTRARNPRVRLVCQECGRKWSVSPIATDPQCPRCGSVDWEVVDNG